MKDKMNGWSTAPDSRRKDNLFAIICISDGEDQIINAAGGWDCRRSVNSFVDPGSIDQAHFDCLSITVYLAMPPASHEEYTSSDIQLFTSPRVSLAEDASSRNKTSTVARRVLNAELSAKDYDQLDTLCPISALPAELLVRIFEFYASIQPAGEYIYYHRSLGWIEVTHVCRLWRDAALQSSCLWSDVCCIRYSTQWTELMLTRAKAAPISIIHDVTWETPESLHFISEHLHHTRELSLIGWPCDLQPLVDSLPHTFDTLDTIELFPGSEVSVDGCALVGDNFALPGAMAGSRLRSLRRLALRAFWVPWSAPILCRLTHLEVQLHKPRKPAEEAYLTCAHEELFSTLKSMPDLKTLILSDCFPSAPWKNGESDILQLPRLTVLRLQGPAAVCFGIAKRLQIPASCQVHLRCNDNVDITEIIPFLMTHVGDGSVLPLWHTLSIKASNENVHLDMWRLSDALKEEQNPFKPELCADLAVWFCTTEQSLRPLKALCQMLPLQTLRIVHVLTVRMEFASQDWIDIFGQSTEIERVSVYSNSAISFCYALSMATDPKLANTQDGTQARFVLEKLLALELREVDFRSDWGGDDCVDCFCWGIVEWLTERRQAGIALTLTIGVTACDVEEEWINSLRCEARVNWDRQEGECDPEYDDWDDDSDEDD